MKLIKYNEFITEKVNNNLDELLSLLRKIGLNTPRLFLSKLTDMGYTIVELGKIETNESVLSIETFGKIFEDDDSWVYDYDEEELGTDDEEEKLREYLRISGVKNPDTFFDNLYDKFKLKIVKDEVIVTEELDGSTTASPGSGPAVGGPGSGDAGMTFTSAAGTSVSGGDSGTAFSTNSNVSGMGAVKSAQPSSKPGDVKGSTKGSGDIGSKGGSFMKTAAGEKKKKKKRKSKRNQIAAGIDNLYVTKYTESFKDNKVIAKWETFEANSENWEDFVSEEGWVKYDHSNELLEGVFNPPEDGLYEVRMETTDNGFHIDEAEYKDGKFLESTNFGMRDEQITEWSKK